jgi:hypothetical protein
MAISQNFPSIAPSLSLNFASSRTLDPRITFTRTSSATCVGPNGLLRVVPANAPRFDHNPVTGESLGLLVEEARTNSIRNNTMVGAVAGTPGTDPANWTAAAPGNGITKELVGTGIENGIAYIDYRYYGTPTATGTIDIRPESIIQVAAASGQTWTSSFYVKLTGGSLANTAVQNWMAGRASSGAFVPNQWSVVGGTPTTAPLIAQRPTATFTFTDATVAFASNFVRLYYTNGLAIDITLRIGMPQLEQGAFATSVIPTSGTTVTRSADVASITGSNFSSWYRQDEGTLFAEGSSSEAVPSGTFPQLVSISDGTTSNEIRNGYASATSGGLTVTVAGATQANLSVSTTAIRRKITSTYKLDDFAVTINGSAVGTDTSGTIPTVDQIRFGARPTGGNPFNGHIRQLAYWPQRLPNSILQTLTK